MTAPVNVSVGDRVTATLWNNLIAWLDGSSNSYTPTLSSSGTQPTLGTGSTVLGTYTEIGERADVDITINFGTSGAAQGSGTYFVALPVNWPNPSVGPLLGTGKLKCAGLTYEVDAVGVTGNPSVLKMKYLNGTTWADVGGGAPGVFTNNDQVQLKLSYTTV